MIKWIVQHARTIGGAAGKLVRSPVTTLLNVVVIAVALALPAALYIALVNIQSAVRGAAPEPQLTLFMAVDAGEPDARVIDTRLRAHGGVARFRFVPREQALEDMKRASGTPGIAEGLERNPLPDAFVIDTWDTSAEGLGRLKSEIEAWPKVGHVQLDAAWAQRLESVVRFGRLATLMLGTVLAFALVAITFNTIRLQILTRREEIEVASLIGATDGFIRRPFLYYGGLLGIVGGLAAWGLISAGTFFLDEAVMDLARAYGADWRLRNLALRDTLSLVAFAAVLGWLGAWLSVARHLSQTRPR